MPSDNLIEVVNKGGFEWLVVNKYHAWMSGQLPKHHDDPFDRLLAAQAKLESLKLITKDTIFKKYGVSVV